MFSNAFVVLMGMGTVFFGLVCIVLLIMIMGKIIGVKKPAAEPAKSAAPAAVPAAAPAPKAANADPALIAIISAALAEELGTDVSNVVVTSITKA